MFSEVCKKNRKAIFGLYSKLQIDGLLITESTGTAFMIAPNILVTPAHCLYSSNQKCSDFEVVSIPNIGKSPLKKVYIIAEDLSRDIALLKIDNSEENDVLTLEKSIIPNGTLAGSIGFPFSEILPKNNNSRTVVFPETFQGFFISSYGVVNLDNLKIEIYQTDKPTYGGASGSPGFLVNGKVFGMLIRNRSQEVSYPTEGTAFKMKFKMQLKVKSEVGYSIWVPSTEIINFALENGIQLDK